jgi:ammonia channel protein AmtB
MPARRLAAPVTVIAVGSFAWWVTGLPPFSTAATVAVVGSGAVAAMVSSSGRRAPGDDVVTPRSAAIWGALAAAFATWQVNALVRHPRSEHPTLSSLANAVLDPRPVRTLAFMGWLAGMAWLARR